MAEGVRRPRGWGLVGWGIVLAALNLRPALATVGPVLGEIQQDFGLTAAEIAGLGSLPLLCFGVVALGAPAIARSLSVAPLLAALMFAVAVGLVLRVAPLVGALFVGTLLVGASIAVCNVLVPAIIKSQFPHRSGFMMGAYVGSMTAAAAVAAAVTVPIARLTSGWRPALAVWGLPAAVAGLYWLHLWRSGASHLDWERKVVKPRPRLSGNATAWSVTAYMGLQSLSFYTILTWLPSIYRSHGISPEVSGMLLAIVITIGVPVAAVLPTIAARRQSQSWWAAAATGVAAVGIAGTLVAPTWNPILWVALLGMGQGAAFPLALLLVVLRSGSPSDAARLSGMSQSFGYLLAAVGPVAFGLLRDLAGTWNLPLSMLLLLSVPQFVAGGVAGREGQIRMQV